MKTDVVNEMAVGNFLIQIRSRQVDAPGLMGWIAAWSVYPLPWHPRRRPVYAGETETQGTEMMAADMAKAIDRACGRPGSYMHWCHAHLPLASRILLGPKNSGSRWSVSL